MYKYMYIYIYMYLYIYTYITANFVPIKMANLFKKLGMCGAVVQYWYFNSAIRFSSSSRESSPGLSKGSTGHSVAHKSWKSCI